MKTPFFYWLLFGRRLRRLVIGRKSIAMGDTLRESGRWRHTATWVFAGVDGAWRWQVESMSVKVGRGIVAFEIRWREAVWSSIVSLVLNICVCIAFECSMIVCDRRCVCTRWRRERYVRVDMLFLVVFFYHRMMSSTMSMRIGDSFRPRTDIDAGPVFRRWIVGSPKTPWPVIPSITKVILIASIPSPRHTSIIESCCYYQSI